MEEVPAQDWDIVSDMDCSGDLVAVRATLPPSILFADRALLHRGYSISDPKA